MLRNLKNFNPPEVEEKVLSFWKEKDIFKKTLIPKKGGKTKTFRFFEGPPTANGRPGIHHVIARVFKDVILRYKTMQGFTIPRKSGWDTHGLPVEIQVEKQLGLTSKKDIEKFGISEFNKKCKESVWLYQNEFEKLTERIGFWLDMENPYVTYHKDYMESLWWIIKQIWNKGLIYKGFKIVNWCPRCGTSLSSHELAQGYKEVTDNSVYVKFKLKKGQKIGNFLTDDKTFILSWTTTPWTLPGNIALAVGKDIEYSVYEWGEKGEKIILAKNLYEVVMKNKDLKKVASFKGGKLVGLSYNPLFDVKSLKSENSYKIYEADFVTTTDGTGVVHTAVMYGEDDYKLGQKIGLPQFHTVDEAGKFVSEVENFFGLYVKDPVTEEKIFEYLKENNNLLYKLPYLHEYPHCWRCSTPLLYYARSSWFVAMSKLKDDLIKRNKTINWIPSHIKEGRFGEWIKDIKDWNFSRERYWGTPIPIWQCGKCENKKVLGSFKELSSLLSQSTNEYVLMRHGQAENNVKKISNGDPKEKDKFSLTLKGRVEVKKSADKLKKLKVDLIFASDFLRTKQTAEIVSKELGINKINFDERLREINVGDFEGLNHAEYHRAFPSYESKMFKSLEKGENLADVAQRVFKFILETEGKYKNKKILIVSHEYTLWMIKTVLDGWSQEEAIAKRRANKTHMEEFFATAQFSSHKFFSGPRDENGFADYHKPYIDSIVFDCDKCPGKMKRTKELADVWFDSGAMPFAQFHYPFNVGKENLKSIDFKNIEKDIIYPADYISEAMDQTRGWFYTLLAVSSLLGVKTPYKNVICLGLINDKNGQKMSKSKGNIIDPWTVANKYGIDTVRWYFYTVNSPGETKNFDEEEIGKILRKFLMTVYNSFVFLSTYSKGKINLDKAPSSKNILDKWILLRLSKVILGVEDNMNRYDLLKSGQIIEEFVDDLSRWYIRRSRKRLQRPEDSSLGKKDYENASATLAYVLLQLSKLIAPFAPFFAESLYQSIKGDYKFNSKDSVHLEDWPVAPKTLTASDKKFLENMEKIRKVASLVLAKRSEVGVKVKQPLKELIIKDGKLKTSEELFDILKDEINVKEISFCNKIKEEFELDLNITPELKAEGMIREISRMVQDLRQEAGYVPKDKIVVWIESSGEVRDIIDFRKKELAREIGANKVEMGTADKFDVVSESKVDSTPIKFFIKKVK